MRKFARKKRNSNWRANPIDAIAKLVGFTFDYVIDNPDFVRLLINENILEGRFVRRSRRIRSTSSPLLSLLRETVTSGFAKRRFRKRADPVQLYVSIAGLCFFYIGNIHTLSVLFGRDFSRTAALRQRRAHVIQMVLGYLSTPEISVHTQPASQSKRLPA